MKENILSGESFNGEMSEVEFDARFNSAEKLMKQYLQTLGYDIENDPNMRETPRRFTKVLMKEIARGTYEREPKITVFENRSKYSGIVFEGNIKLNSLCSHHLAFIKGYAYVAYIPKDKVIGLSKLNRIVDWFARRPQLQEQMTEQIHNYLAIKLQTEDVAVCIKATHSCVQMRGVENENSYMITSRLSGTFQNNGDRSRDEFYQMIKGNEKC